MVDLTNADVTIENGNIAVSYILSGSIAKNGAPFKCKATDLFSLVPDGQGGLQIARLVRFFDTWALASAAHSFLR